MIVALILLKLIVEYRKKMSCDSNNFGGNSVSVLCRWVYLTSDVGRNPKSWFQHMSSVNVNKDFAYVNLQQTDAIGKTGEKINSILC